MNYHGIDYVAMVSSILALYLLGSKNRYGFVSLMTANTMWIILGWQIESAAIMIGNIIFFVMNLRGFINWKPAENLLTEKLSSQNNLILNEERKLVCRFNTAEPNAKS